MRLNYHVQKTLLLYVTKTVYIDKKERTITVEKLGIEDELREKLNGQDPYKWAKDYIDQPNKKEQEESRNVIIQGEQSRINTWTVPFTKNAG